ncbi:DUF4145 domain-containing protein [Pseudescherichia sp.]|uniref:DUF4145 domain-containing protein n=1 Tax=Pseudescherichia sp. TaxID=2055881 RepID=UPI0028A91C02|nr:DUF4145 domain-containing protein [Pseudescherichia sp.]
MSWICPHCNHAASIRSGDRDSGYFDFSTKDGHKRYFISGIKCPNPECNRAVVHVFIQDLIQQGVNVKVVGVDKVYPVIPSLMADRAKDFPDYIPAGILQDYREACSIADLSPKASATLARRCLQGMIRDFWQVKPDTLYNEIQSIKDEISSDMWDVIDGVRKVGNIGAHMEKDINLIIDVNPEEATLLINMIEMLLDDWYVARFEKQQRIEKMKQLAVDKTQAKKT